MDILTIIGLIAAVIGIPAAIVQVLDYLQERRKKPAEQDQTAPRPAAPHIPHNLPPRSEFIGRQVEKARVHEALRSRSYLVSIGGIGGIGKTVLALEVACECLRASKGETPASDVAVFAGFVWTTAKDRDLTLYALLDAIALTLEYPGIAQQPPEEKQTAVEKLLREKSYLVVVDNFETVADEGVRRFLLDLPEPSKALITSREHKLPQAWTISLTGLTEAEALALVRSEGRRLGLPALERAEDRGLLHLYRATGGAPLAIKWAVGQIKQRGQSLDTVLAALHQARGNIFDQIFSRSWSLLSTSARQALIVTPLFAAAASRAALEAASDVHHFAFDEALGQLVEMSLVDATDELDQAQRRYSVHPLTRAFATARLQQTPETGAFERIVAYYRRFVTPPPKMQTGALYWDYLLFDHAWGQSLEREWANLYYVIRRALDEGRDADALALFLPLVHFLSGWGLWNERLQLGREMCGAAHRLGDATEAWLWIDALGHILHRRRQIEEWAEALERGKAVAGQLGLTEALTLAEAHEALLLYEKGEAGPAVQKIEFVLAKIDAELARARDGVRQIVASRVAGLAGIVYQGLGKLDRAKELLERDLALRRAIGENPAPVLARLGYLNLRLNDIASAQAVLSQALEIAGPNQLARIHHGLALIAAQKGEMEEARRLCRLAAEQYARLGYESGVQRCQELLARLSGPADRGEQQAGYRADEP